jgi:LuxR family maltose regulon positive regulatory protein
MQKPSQVLHTKICLPFIRPSLVGRSRLQQQIAHGLRVPLTVVIAPAGFGKTTLVASSVAGFGLPVTWLSLDKNDNQIERFLNYLVAAFQVTNPGSGKEAEQLLAGIQHVPPDTVLTSLINNLGTLQNDMILVLDDYHFISSQDVHDKVTFLLEHCPGTLHLVIASRSDPPLPLARLRARGQLVELRAADLRFTTPEAAQFLNEIMDLRLDIRWVEALEERTEGWIAGLQMAALSMREREDVRGFIEGFSGTNRYILDYLLEEVLASQPPEVKRFLLYTSILERLTAPLCEAILEDGVGDNISSTHQTCQQTLEYLERANLFLVPLDDERQSYRYHHLFADLLRTQLQKSLRDEEVTRLHLRASEWHEQNGSTLEAIHYASLATDFERIERLIEQNYTDMLNRGEMSGILRFWMGKLGKDLVYRRPWLCLYQAFSHSWFGQLEEASQLLKEAEKRIRSEEPGSHTRAMLGYHDYVQSRVTAMRGDTQRALAFCLRARENIPSTNLGLQIEVGITLGYEYFLYGDFSSARRVLNEMIDVCHSVGAINNPVAAYALLARIHVLQGRLHDAYDLFEKAAGVVDDAGRQYLGAVSLVEVGKAALLCEWNDVETALVRVEQGLEYLPSWGKADDFVLAYTTLSRIQLALGNTPDAASAVEKADHLIRACGVFSEARSEVETARVKLWLAQEAWPAIERWMTALENRFPSHELLRYEDELTRITQARVFIAQNKPDNAIRLLSCLEESARAGGREGRLIEILILTARALQAVGDPRQADIALTKSLYLAQPGGYTRIFLEEGSPLQRLLTQWLARAGDSSLQNYAAQLLSQFDPDFHSISGPQKKAPTSDALLDPLSPRELEVLHLLALGRTNPEIARQLIVARGTVKAHTASIYRKLDAGNRTEAVARARQLGILP